MSRVTAQSGDVAGARPVPWSVAHPGVAALASSCAAIAGLTLVVVFWVVRNLPGAEWLTP